MAACGDDDPSPDGGSLDAAQDVRSDVRDANSDGALDATNDAAEDASADGGMDGSPDGMGPDATPDTGRGDVATPDAGAPLGDMWSVELSDGSNIDGEDEIRLVCDDATPGAGGHQPCDVGAGSFTYEVWIKADAADNPQTSGVGLDAERSTYRWIDGAIFIDRDAFGGSCDGRDFGASIIDGRVAFGVGQLPSGGPLTIYGSTPVVQTPAVWRHIAVVYDDDVSPNQLRVYVDGALDVQSTGFLGDADRSIPDMGCTQGSASSAARQVEIAFGNEKHGFDGIALVGRIARFRIWSVARTTAELAATWDAEVGCAAPGLVGDYPLEEGMGGSSSDVCGRSPNAIVDLGTRSLTRWVADGP